MTEQEIEDEIRQKKLDAPRLTPDYIDGLIVDELYHVFPNTTTTVCCLVLKNNSTVVGESACVSRANFDAELGRKVAKEKARREIWIREGYLLAQRLFEETP